MKTTVCWIAALMLSTVSFSAVSAQDKIQDQKPLSQADQQQEPPVKWLWGEVTSVDAGAGKLEVRYVDFDTDTDQSASLKVDAQTVIEGVAGLAEIKAGDTLSVDYSSTPEGTNLARMISVERIEDEDGELKADIPLNEALAEEAVGSDAEDEPAAE